MTHAATFRSWPEAHAWLTRLSAWVKGNTLQGRPVTITAAEEERSPDQNALMWAILTAFSKQLVWPVNGQMVKMAPEDWKDVLSAAFKKESARLAMGLDGGVVMLGMRTSKMGKAKFSEFIDFLHAVAADRGVDCSMIEPPNPSTKGST